MRIPVIDLGECVDCDACVETCPNVFRRNDAGYIEVLELHEYPEEAVLSKQDGGQSRPLGQRWQILPKRTWNRPA